MASFPNARLLLSREIVAVDCETTGLDWLRGDRVFGISLSWAKTEAEDEEWVNLWGDTPNIESWYGDIRDSNVWAWVKYFLPQFKRTVGHAYKFDVHMLRESGIHLPLDRIDCTMIRECILDEDQYEYNLERIAQDRLGHGKEVIWPELAAIFGGKPTRDDQIKNLARAPQELVARYANIDSSSCLEIWYKQEFEINAQELQQIADLECRLLGAVIEMERGGVRVDVERAVRSIPQLNADIDVAQKRLDGLAGKPVNVNSGPQVKTLLGVHKADTDGRWYTRDGVLLEPTESGNSGQLKAEKLYQCKLPEATLIAQVRGMIKARDVFLKKYICEMSHKGYIHAHINQTRSEEGDGTYTGRFSITEPALQQIHKRNKAMAAVVRSCFLPDEGCEWGCYDWSQKDFRIFAHYVNDPRINRIYLENAKADFHGTVAGITGLPRDRDEKTGGANAKQMNLGLIFGMSAGRMAKEMNLPYTKDDKGFFRAGPEAQALFAKYHDNIPGANRLKESVASVARTRGYIKTMLGRRLRFNGSDAYKAAGILFQAQAAESMKVKTVELAQMLKQIPDTPARLMLLVHDEFDLSMGIGRCHTLDNEIKLLLQRFDGSGEFPLKYRIPILAEMGLGPTWYEASV